MTDSGDKKIDMKEKLTEVDIQWLAKIIAMIPGLDIPADTIKKLETQLLITQTPIGWQATETGILSIICWDSSFGEEMN